MPHQTVDGLWGQKASGSGLETTSGVPSKHPFLLETELCGSLDMDPYPGLLGLLPVTGPVVLQALEYTCSGQMLLGVTLGTGQEVGGGRRVEV